MRLLLAVVLVGAWCAQSVFVMATETDTLPIEQKLLDDIATRMQEQLHNTADLLEKIRQSHGVKERENLIHEYHKSMKTTMAIDRLIDQIQETVQDAEHEKGKMMKDKKTAAGMGCCMMNKKSTSKESANESRRDADKSPAIDDTTESNKGSAQDEHEGHH